MVSFVKFYDTFNKQKKRVGFKALVFKENMGYYGY